VKKVKGVHCCWVCIQCRDYEIITDEQRCFACPNGTFPTSSPARNVCEPLPVDYLSLDSRWAVFPIVFSVIGIAPAIASGLIGWLLTENHCLAEIEDTGEGDRLLTYRFAHKKLRTVLSGISGSP